MASTVSPFTSLYDVAIVGGGIVGLSCALEARQRGLTVALVDPAFPRQRASFGNAGVISRGSILPVAGPSIWRNLPRYLRGADKGLRLHLPAMAAAFPWLWRVLAHSNQRHWRHAAAALNPLTAACYDAHMRLAAFSKSTSLISRNGWIKLYRSEAGFAKSALERQIMAEHKVATETLDGGQIAALEPALRRRYARGVLFTETGFVEDPGHLVENYCDAFIAHNGHWITAEVESLGVKDSIATLKWNGGQVQAKTLVLAAGAKSAALARQLSYKFPLIAERGYHLHYHPAPNVELKRPVYDTDGAFVLSPMRLSGARYIRVLSGVEIARPGDPPTPVQLKRVLPDALGTIDLAGPVENEPWCGNRPSTPDGLPVIGRARRHANLIFAFGHGHIGLSTGPITGRIVADLLTNAAPPFDISAYRAERFRGAR